MILENSGDDQSLSRDIFCVNEILAGYTILGMMYPKRHVPQRLKAAYFYQPLPQA